MPKHAALTDFSLIARRGEHAERQSRRNVRNDGRGARGFRNVSDAEPERPRTIPGGHLLAGTAVFVKLHDARNLDFDLSRVRQAKDQERGVGGEGGVARLHRAAAAVFARLQGAARAVPHAKLQPR